MENSATLKKSFVVDDLDEGASRPDSCPFAWASFSETQFQRGSDALDKLQAVALAQVKAMVKPLIAKTTEFAKELQKIFEGSPCPVNNEK